MEIWCVIDEYPDYMISNKGNVQRIVSRGTARPGNILKQEETNRGYLRVPLVANGVQKKLSVHRLVAKHFLEAVEGKCVCNHKDCCKTNNDVSNLEWCSHKENSQHAVSMGKIIPIYGEGQGSSKLKVGDVLHIKSLLKTGAKGAVLSKEFKVSISNISAIKTGRNWKHLDNQGLNSKLI
jgi:hypothetical protein